MTALVRYNPNGGNEVLTHVLRQVWNLQCYWCEKFKDYLDLEIDHILPKSATDAERNRFREALGLPENYDVHSAYNLAPICGHCNRRKGQTDLTTKGLVLTHLNKARKLAPTVSRHVQTFGRATKLGEALLFAAEVDLTKEDTRATFEAGAPAIVQRLAELGEGKAEYVTHREVTVATPDDEHTFFVSLNEHGRAAVQVLEQVVGAPLGDALATPIADLFHRGEAAVADEYRAREDRAGEPAVGSVAIQWPALLVHRVAYTASAPAQIEFEFEGTLDGLATASVSRPSWDGSDLDDAQEDAIFSCRFKFDLNWDPGDGPGNLFFDQVWLEEFQAETLVDGKSIEPWWD